MELLDEQKKSSPILNIVKILGILVMLYLFILAIKLMGASFKGFGKGFSEALVSSTSNPIVGLFVGILATSIIQSSSTTTSMLVALVASGQMPFSVAIPMVMGANIGTAVTNAIVSLTHISRPDEFKKAFSGAIVHDYFNIFAVAAIFPIEYFFHPLEKLTRWLAGVSSEVAGVDLTSGGPLKAIIDPVKHLIVDATGETYWLTLIIAFVLLFVALRYLVKLMRSLVIDRFEGVLHNYLFKTPVRAFILGIIFTAIVQSSSITTALVVPLLGSGLLTLEQIFPYTLGANVGTTVTALLAALAAGTPAGMAVAFTHLFFNVFGIAIFYPLRKLPLALARKTGELVMKHRFLAIVLILLLFFIIPGAVILLLG